MSHPEATHSDQRPASEALASNRDESDEMDRAETVVYQALADNLMGRLNRGPQWNTIEQIMASLHDEARNILGALKAARIALVELPEPYPDETIHPYWTVNDVNGPQVVGVTDSDAESEAEWVYIEFTARSRTVDAQTARALGAAFFAAADAADPAAVGARITVEEA